MGNRRLKKVTLKISAMILAVVLLAVVSVVSQADNVVILEESSPELTFLKIHKKTTQAADVWDDITGSYSQNQDKYSISSNGYAQWYEVDSLHFAYKSVAFNYGAKANLVIETQLDSWNPVDSNAGAGILLRSGLQPNAATVMLHARPGRIMITSRAKDGMNSLKGGTYVGTLHFPIKFKMVLNKNTVTCYYKQKTDSQYIKLGAQLIQYSGLVYAGLSAYSQKQDNVPEAKFTGYSYQVEAPEGTTVLPDDGSGGDVNVPEEEEPEVLLPDDMPVGDDVLLYESFSDNSMFEGDESKTNPIWITDNFADPNIITNEEITNRYLYEYQSSYYYYAGNHNWTDYETSLDITFTDETNFNLENKVDIYTRLTTTAQYGYHAYVVRFTDGNKIQLGYIEGNQKLSPIDGGSQYVLTNNDSYEYNYLENLNTNIHLTIRTFDNKITVYMDDGTGTKEILHWEDNHNFIKVTGKIGFSTTEAAVTFDNIKVTKLTDLLGGDYDNQIGGKWDEPILGYIQEQYINKGYIY